MVTELYRVDWIDVEAEQLEGEDSAFVANVAMNYMALDAQDSWSLRRHATCRLTLSTRCPRLESVLDRLSLLISQACKMSCLDDMCISPGPRARS